MWVAPQIPLAQRGRPGPCGDFTDLPTLASAAAARMPFEQLLADAGNDGEANHRHCREGLGVDSLIPAKKRRSARVIATTPLRQETVRQLGKPGVEAGRVAYRQKSSVETVMSFVKRRHGEALTAKLDQRGASRRCGAGSPTTSSASSASAPPHEPRSRASRPHMVLGHGARRSLRPSCAGAAWASSRWAAPVR